MVYLHHEEYDDENDLLIMLPGSSPGEEIKIIYGPLPDPTFATLPKIWHKRLAFLKTTLPQQMHHYREVIEEAVEAELPLPSLWNHLGTACILAGEID